jgi:hypothetical protein
MWMNLIQSHCGYFNWHRAPVAALLIRLFGSFWSGIKLIQLEPKTGKRSAPDSPMYSLAYDDSIKASHIHRRSDFLLSVCELGSLLSRDEQHARNPRWPDQNNHRPLLQRGRPGFDGRWRHSIFED